MNILLVYIITEYINMPVIPLGMACIADSAKEAGHNVRQVTFKKQDIPVKLAGTIKEFTPDVIGFSVRNIDDQSIDSTQFLLDPVKDAIACCRTCSGAPVVLGGAGFSMFPKSVLDYVNADMGIKGEGERAFVTLLDRMSRKQDLKGIPGLYFRDTDDVKPVELIRDMDQLPLPLSAADIDLSLFPDDEEFWIPVQTRRGCPMNCSYCSTGTIEGNIPRRRSAGRVITLLEHYVNSGFDHFFFVDNTFNFPPTYASELCSRIIASGLNISWRCILYPYKADENLVKMMADAGCREVSFGFESGSQKILKMMNKRYGPDDIRKVSGLLKKYSIRRMGFLLLGGPGETKETVMESIAFAESLNLDMVRLTMGIRIYPETEVARIAVEEGIIEPDDDLLQPRFYVARGLDELLKDTLTEVTLKHPNWIV